MLNKIICSLFLSAMAFAAIAADPLEGKQYSLTAKPVSEAPDVVEFFSFYCPPCMKFEEVYRVSDKVDAALPAGAKTEKIHVSQIGPLGKALTDAWSVAKFLNVENKVEGPLFEATQTKRTLKTEADIRQVFIDAGVPAEKYDMAKGSFAVKALTQKQNQAVEKFAVTGTPAYYVKGQYLIKLNGMQSATPEAYTDEFADVVTFLLNKN